MKKNITSQTVKFYGCERFSGYPKQNWERLFRVIKKHQYYATDKPITGNAPKDFIHLYTYRQSPKVPAQKWPGYISKVGHKWYPIESMTELLLNKIGETIGLDMANSELVIINRQLRFLSRYFLRKDERLIHGAEIYSGYLNDDLGFVHDVEDQHLSPEWFTFQFTAKALGQIFGASKAHLFESYVKMLLFDAIVGNNDRHIYNWGVIISVKDSVEPIYSPIYDTARGLFWNTAENKIKGLSRKKIEDYAKSSKPKAGWDDCKNLTHFELVEKISQDNRFTFLCKDLINEQRKKDVLTLVKEDYGVMFSKERLAVILSCLEYRFDTLISIIS